MQFKVNYMAYDENNYFSNVYFANIIFCVP